MRRIVTAITAAALALSLVSYAYPANAAAGFDSAYAGESAFLTLTAGQSGTFTVFFANTGTSSWVKGTATQVDLAACKEDKTTCDAQDTSEAPFNSGWLSATRYATHTQTTVAPGSIGTFTYNVMVPAGQAAGTYRFNGALVVSATSADVHNEGYFQDVTVPAAPAVSCTPTKIELSPTTANNQVGVTHTETATVTCEPATGSTTRVLTANAQVTFVIDAPVGSLNADLTLTATTDANGKASVSWTRSNPDVDSITAYPTSFPAVRATATKTWSAGAAVITCTPTDAATLLAGGSRTYTVQVNSPTTGSASTNTVTVSRGSSDTATLSATTLTPDSSGKALFSVVGTDTQFATPKVSTTFTISGNATTFSATCGKVTFEAVRAATVTLTPDTTATQAMGSHRIFTVTAVDQFGAAFTGTLKASFTELTDGDASTTTAAVIDNVTTTAPSSASTATCAAASGFSGNQSAAVALSSTGTAYFQICAASPDSGKTTTTATPIAWQDRDGNGVPGTGEGQDTGGATTWEAAAVTSAKLSPSSATNAASTDTIPGTNDNSFGEETYTAFVIDQSGNQINPTASSTAVVTVTNTGSNNVFINVCLNGDATAGTTSGTTITPGGFATCTGTLATTGLQKVTVEVDSNGSGSATLTCQITVGSTILTCSSATKTWVSSGTIVLTAGSNAQTASGKVVAFDKTQTQSWYTISTTVANFTVVYVSTDAFTVDGATATITSFNSNIGIGDTIVYTGGGNSGFSAGGSVHHKLTNG